MTGGEIESSVDWADMGDEENPSSKAARKVESVGRRL